MKEAWQFWRPISANMCSSNELLLVKQTPLSLSACVTKPSVTSRRTSHSRNTTAITCTRNRLKRRSKLDAAWLPYSSPVTASADPVAESTDGLTQQSAYTIGRSVCAWKRAVILSRCRVDRHDGCSNQSTGSIARPKR